MWIAIFSASCAPSKFLTSVQPAEIQEMLKIEPISHISLIEKGNEPAYNDSISKSAEIILNESLAGLGEKLHLCPEEQKTADSLERKALKEEIDLLFISVEQDKKKKNTTPITPLIDSILTTNNKRFGLIIAQEGFTRSKRNYRGQIAKGLGIGVLTLGMFYTVPYKANSMIYALIVDNKDKNVTFFNRSFILDQEPTKRENIDKQLRKIFENHLWKREDPPVFEY